MDSKKKVMTLIMLVLGLVVAGTLGYMVLLDLALVDAMYMTVITISTVGYKEVADMTSEAKLFSMLLIIMSIGTVGYLVSNIVSFFLEGEVKEVWRKRRMDNAITSLENHYIICGAGETGIFVINQFKKQEVPFVVIDKDAELCERLKEENVNYVHGDATMDQILEKAGILKAKGLIASLGKYSENVYTVLTARQMNEKLHIVARSIDEHAHEKLIKAGADNAVSPNEIGGILMASLVLKP
ncbi:MAG: potassium channel family protein [Clostridium sp.]|nr:potassium channel family protein [Clostridium sp.]